LAVFKENVPERKTFRLYSAQGKRFLPGLLVPARIFFNPFTESPLSNGQKKWVSTIKGYPLKNNGLKKLLLGSLFQFGFIQFVNKRN
jgi:hypothetical protein